eukprot:Gb_32359 [translate_table: standard]
MEGTKNVVLIVIFAFLLKFCFKQCDQASAATVTYDHRALIIDGQRRVLISGSIHYPRSTPEMWPDLIQKSKDGGLDVIETYVFWDMHEPIQGQYYFEGRFDLVKFVKTVQQAGLFVHLRIGPYACAEWNYGGFPVWLHFIPGIKFRTDNGPFKDAFASLHICHPKVCICDSTPDHTFNITDCQMLPFVVGGDNGLQNPLTL